MTPKFITFTGADDWTCIHGMRALSQLYPVEWGILFSPSRQGKDPRYPGPAAQCRLLWSGLDLAAHLCGEYSRMIMAGESLVGHVPVDLGHFTRVQVNHSDPEPWRIEAVGNAWGTRCIAQTRDLMFMPWDSIDWLFDGSGGRGIVPAAWPSYPGRKVGYAGGIGPDNVLDVITAIGATGPYWIDMESGVRTDDRFDLAKVRRVCELVYGDAP